MLWLLFLLVLAGLVIGAVHAVSPNLDIVITLGPDDVRED